MQRVYLEGAGLALLFPQLWPLRFIAAATLPAVSWMFRHRLTSLATGNNSKYIR